MDRMQLIATIILVVVVVMALIGVTTSPPVPEVKIPGMSMLLTAPASAIAA